MAMAAIRKKLVYSDIPSSLKGLGITIQVSTITEEGKEFIK